MKKLREIRTKIDAYIQTHKPAAFIMWLLVLLFPLWLSLSGNAISFLSGEDGAAVLLRTLLTENYGAFLLGMLLIYLFFGAMVCLWKHVPLAALLTGLIFTLMPTVDFLKTEILKEHFLPWDMLLAKNADSFTTFLSALKIPTPLWWLWGGTVAYLAVLAILRPTLPIAWKKRVLGAPILLGCLYLCTMNGTVRADYSLLGLSSEAPTDQTKNYTENGFLTAFVLNLSSLNMGDPDNYSYYCDGSISLQSDSGDSYIKCYDGEEHGQVDLLESFAESCNASFANLGLSISVDKMNEVANSLLFNQTLPTKFTTAKSQFSLSNTDSQWQIGATAIGQGNTVISPIHAAMLVSAIANGGTLMKPYVIDSVQSTEGSVIEQYESENYGTLMSTSESSQLTKMMKAVVEEGTGYKLSGKNYSVAGKTGTAEVVGRGNNAWFVGFAPADDPKIAICVLVEDAGTASSEAVPIAGEILDAYLNN